MIYALMATGLLSWYGLGRIAHAYAEGLRLACYYEWDNSFAILMWPFFAFCILAEMLAKRAVSASLKQKHADAMMQKALRELENE